MQIVDEYRDFVFRCRLRASKLYIIREERAQYPHGRARSHQDRHGARAPGGPRRQPGIRRRCEQSDADDV